jgi:hypothetical protein
LFSRCDVRDHIGGSVFNPGALATATMASIQGGLLLTQIRRDPHQLRIALSAARSNLRFAAA